jgi:hypothetical protein
MVWSPTEDVRREVAKEDLGMDPHKEEREEDDHEGPGPITSRRPWQPGTLMSKIPGPFEVEKRLRETSAKDVGPSMMMMMNKL